jgi:hypothetical protein
LSEEKLSATAPVVPPILHHRVRRRAQGPVAFR